MKATETMSRARQALADPEALAMMRHDRQFDRFFGPDGRLAKDISEPGLLRRLTQAAVFGVRRRTSRPR